ncbi:MAG: RecX family transcriptional regulator [Flavobacterium sp.]
MNSKSPNNTQEIIQKLEYYCSYQERCHIEVQEKLHSFILTENERNQIIVHLIDSNFLNEERFALTFSISKFHQKYWGKVRIKNELKVRKISDYLITKGLNSIPQDEYNDLFEMLSERVWNTITEKNKLKKQKKFCDTLLRKGWESDKIYEKAKLFANE